MLKTFRTRVVSFFLAILLLMALVPMTTVFAEGDEPIEFDVPGVSLSNFTGDQYSGVTGPDSFRVSATGTVSGCNYASATGRVTLTVASDPDEDRVLTFDYTLLPGLTPGTISFGDTVVETGGTYIKKINAGESFSLVISATTDTCPCTDAIDVMNVMLDVYDPVSYVDAIQPTNDDGDLDYGTVFIESGSAPYTGGAPRDSVEVTPGVTKVYMTAVPKTGYQFAGFYNPNTDAFISDSINYNCVAYNGMAITAKFVPTTLGASAANAYFKVGSYYTASLNDALDYARYTTNKVVAVNKPSCTVPAGDYTVPYGVTLLVPFDAENTLYKTTPENVVGPATTSIDYRYCLLTLADGATITIENGGAVSASAKHPATHTNASYNGAVAGYFSQIDMNAGSAIIVEDGGQLFAWGFITGEGNVIANYGGEVYEFFQINDFRGGSVSSAMSDSSLNQFFFNQYYVQNIEASLTINYGATEYVCIDVFASGQTVQMCTAFIGKNGAFRLDDADASISKQYHPDEDVMYFDVSGTSSLHSISVEAMGMEVSTDNFYLPINNIIVSVHDDAVMNMDKKVIFLPGSGVNVEEGAQINITGNGSVVVADKDDPTIQQYSKDASLPLKPVTFSPTKTGVRTWDDSTEDAFINNNGTVTVSENGSLASTSGGANIYGDGTVTIDSSAEPPVLTLALGDGKPANAQHSATEEADLQNEDGSSINTEVRWCEPATFRKINGLWGDYRYVAAFMENETTELKSSADLMTRDQFDAFVADIPTQTKEEDETNTYEFEGEWEIFAYDDVSNTVMFKPVFVSHSKNMPVHWYDANGDWICDTEVLSGQYPDPIPNQNEYPDAYLYKESTVDKTYTLAWYDVRDPETVLDTLPVITEETSFHATFIEKDRTYTITWRNYNNGTTGIATNARTTKVKYGDVPTHVAPTSGRPSGSSASDFYGWYNPTTKETYAQGNLPPVTGAATYYAVFYVNSKWKDSDGTELYSGKVLNSAPAPDAAHMSLPDTDDQKFVGWYRASATTTVWDSASIPAVTSAISNVSAMTFTAVYENNVKGKSLSLNGLIGENIQFEDGVTVTAGDLSFKVTETGVTKSASYTAQMILDAMNRISIQLAPAEMTYKINANYTLSSGGKRSLTTSGAAYADSLFADSAASEAPLDGHYYLVGTFNGNNCWADNIRTGYELIQNPGNPGEYMLLHVLLHAGDEFKAICYNFDGNNNNYWYGDVNQTIGTTGVYTIYFCPGGNGAWSSYYFYVQADSAGDSYTQAMLNRDRAKDVTAALMNYGTKAQQYFGRNITDLANNHVNGNTYTYFDDETDAKITAYDAAHPNTMPALKAGGDRAEALASNYGLQYVGTNLVLNAGITIRHHFLIVDAAKVPNTVTFTSGGEEYIAVKVPDATGYYVSYEYVRDGSGIPGAELGDEVTISFSGDGKETVSGNYNAFNYVKLVLNSVANNPSEKNLQLAAMLRAMYWYYVEAKTYFTLIGTI